VIQYLSRAGAVVDAQDAVGNTALHFCTRHKNPWSIRSLLRAGSNIYTKNNNGDAPLFMCRTEAAEFHTEIKWVGFEPSMEGSTSMSDTVILLENKHAENVLAFTMGLHDRLGKGTAVSTLDEEILRIALDFL
jgi:hypothetical protein